MKKIRIAVSACLIGLKYRYDGTSRMNMDIVNTLKDRVDFIPVCPEVECGLSTPRPPMRLETSASGTRIRVIETGEDVTDAMLDWAQNKLDKLERLKIDAYIFKSNSPSCGWENVEKFNRAGRRLSSSGQGIFAALVKRRFPNLPVVEESDFPELLNMMDDRTDAQKDSLF